MKRRIKYQWAMLLIIAAFILLPAISSFAETTTYHYDDVNHVNRVESGTPGSTSTYSISGIVTSNGSALAGVTITLSGGGSPITTDSNGFYVFSGLSNGAYTMTPSQSGYTFSPPSRSVTISGADAIAQNFTAFQPPTAPLNLIALTTSYSQINLSWTDNANNEDGFQIERSLTGVAGSFSQIAVVGANIVTYSDTNLSENTTYYYRVKAYNTGGNSGYSNTANATTLLAAPTNLSAIVASTSQITLSWTDNSNNETGFAIERKTGSGSYVQIATVGANVTTYSNTGLSSSTTYYYQVRAYKVTVYSNYSNAISTTTSLPAAPSNLNAVVMSTSQINLSWTDNSNNETGFSIQRKTGSGSYVQIATVGANVTTYIDTGVTANTTYYYQVKAYNGVGNSNSSNVISTTTSLPAVPTNLSAVVVSTSQINLGWTDNSNNETGFYIERKTGSGGQYVQIGTVGANVTTYIDTGVTANTTYYYQVRAYNGVGNSNYCVEVNTSASLPAIPLNLYALVVSTSQISLSWTDNSNNETGFYIERKTGNNGTYSQIATVGANKTSYANSGLTANTTYYYQVRAYNGVGTSNYCIETYATTAIPADPSNLTASVASTNQINLSWADNSNNEWGFYIERKAGSSGTYVQIATVGINMTTYADTGVTAGTTYYYQVRAYNGAGTSNYTTSANALILFPVRIGSTYYPTLLAAYNAATDGAIIQSQAITFAENLSINRNISVTLQGGYDVNYTTNSGNVTYLYGYIQTYGIGGMLTMSNFQLVPN